MSINYRKSVLELATDLVGTNTPATNETFIHAYEKWAANRNSKTSTPLTHWSALFITYVARMRGVPAAILPNFFTMEELKTWGETKGRYHSRKDPDYTPRVGDLVLFSDGPEDHVAFYTNSYDGRIEFIEGYLQGKTYGVQQKTRMANSGLIVGYISPDYDWSESKGMINYTQLPAIIKPVRIQEFRDRLTRVYGQDFIDQYVAGTPNGAFTKGWTRVAVAAWQKEMHLPADCITGEFEGDAVRHAADEKPVKQNSRGNKVMLLLGLLYTKGYDPKGFTTRLGADGVAALEAFQKARALPITGVADYSVWDALFNH